jgi:hypothetical protein
VGAGRALEEVDVMTGSGRRRSRLPLGDRGRAVFTRS